MRFLRTLKPKFGALKRCLLHILRQELFRAKIATVYALVKKTSSRPFFILGTPRSGSSLLVSYLNSNPEVFFGGEVLSHLDPMGIRRRWVSKKAALNHLHHFLNAQNHPVCGAKIFFWHLEMRKISLKELCEAFPAAKWLILYRKNILDQYLSHKIAFKTGRWIQYRSADHPKLGRIQMKLVLRSALGYCNRIWRNYEKTLGIPEIGKRSLWISYEELTNKPQILFDRKIFPFLALDSQRVTARTLKQNIWQVPEILTNYETVKEAIRRTDFTQNYENPAYDFLSPNARQLAQPYD